MEKEKEGRNTHTLEKEELEAVVPPLLKGKELEEEDNPPLVKEEVDIRLGS